MDDPAALWGPALSDVLHWHPWDMHKLTQREYDLGVQYIKDSSK